MRRWLGVLAFSLVCGLCSAQDETNSVPAIAWLQGPVTGELARVSTLKIPEGFIFTGSDGTKLLMEDWGNVVTEKEIGILIAPEDAWIAVFEFDPIGYVKDDEKNDLDADAILASIRESQTRDNERRRSMQLTELEIEGWYREPFYNEQTHNLEWCTLLSEKGGGDSFVNHNIRVLGRRGVTEITLIASPDELETAIPELADILKNYSYVSGGSYAEYRKGDKIAKYGLTALVAGGAAAVALKSGLFKHIWKILVLGAAAVSGFFKKLFGKKEQ
jgi:uncharacterized membrane-anchored protein